MKKSIPEHKSLKELYRQLIINHAKHPLNFGKPENESLFAEGINPLCGDKIRVYLNIDENNIIDKLHFEGTGCAISIASASLMTSTLTNINKNKATQYVLSLINNLSQTNPSKIDQSIINSQEIEALEGVKNFPSRIKCATLSWQTFLSALKNNNNNKITTTER